MFQLTLKKAAAGFILCVWLVVRSDGKTRPKDPPPGSLTAEILNATRASPDCTKLIWEVAGDSLPCELTTLPRIIVDDSTKAAMYVLLTLYGRNVHVDSLPETVDPLRLLPGIVLGGNNPMTEDIKDFNTYTGLRVLTYHYLTGASDGQETWVVKVPVTDRSKIPPGVKIDDSTWEAGPGEQLRMVRVRMAAFAGAFDATNRAYLAHLEGHRKDELTRADRVELEAIITDLNRGYKLSTFSENKAERQEGKRLLFLAYQRALRWDEGRHR